jgi:uncharacterized membrane protein YadS
MLGPVVVVLALRHRKAGLGPASDAARLRPARIIPWFIAGFLLLAALRSTGVITAAAAAPLKSLSTWLTVAAMAALGLEVDLAAMRRVGRAVILTATASFLTLVASSVALIRLLSIG